MRMNENSAVETGRCRSAGYSGFLPALERIAMMKRHVGVGLLVLAVLGMLTAVAFAEAPECTPKGAQGGYGHHGPKGGEPGEWFEAMIKSLNLEPEAEAKVRSIFEAKRTQKTEWRKTHGEQFKELRRERREARKAGEGKPGQPETMPEGIKQMRAERKAAHKQFLAQLDEVLDDEQMAKVKKCFRKKHAKWRGAKQRGLQILYALKTLDLTEEQKAQVKQILKDTREKIKGVLTDEQRQQLRERREARKKAFKEGYKKGQEAPTTKPAQETKPPKAEE